MAQPESSEFKEEASPPTEQQTRSEEPSPEALKALNKSVFRDDKWDRAQQHLKSKYWGHAEAMNLLKKGAQAYGFWDLTDESLHGLVNQVLGSSAASEPSPGFVEWLAEQKGRDMARVPSPPQSPSAAMVGAASNRSFAGMSKDGGAQIRLPSNQDRQVSAASKPISQQSEISLSRFGKTSPTRILDMDVAQGVSVQKIRTSRFGAGSPTMDAAAFARHRLTMLPGWKGNPVLDATYLQVVKCSYHVLVLGISTAYAVDVVTNKYPDVIDVFSWPVFFARLGGMACALWTAILFLSMSRGLLGILARFLPRKGRNFWFTFLDSHKDIHIMSGKALVTYASIHVVGHCIGTVPGMLKKSVEELNELLGCSQDDPPYILDLGLDLYWPDCPLTDSNKPENFTEALFLTMPGLTGVLLVLILAAVAYTSKGVQRAKNFELFWYVHNGMLLAWPVLLFLHGSQGWIGVGIPLVLLAVTVPILTYSTSRIRRLVRYYMFAGRCVRILRATVRPGRDGSAAGAVTGLEIKPPPSAFWSFRPGTYAFLCMPEYARMQWHPFTITSGQEDDTVNFLIAAVGDWTQELAERCLRAAQGNGTLPCVALDGPYVAPTMSAMEKKVLVAVGAGVGITPFISLLSTFIAELPSEQGKHAQLVEAHFYWMTRNPSEFIFGWRLLHKWLEDERLQAKIFIHLYTTAKDPAKDASAYLFREAVKRQSAVDRSRFQDYLPEWQASSATCRPGPQFPWCWAEGQEADLLWVKCPNWDSDVGANGFVRVKEQDYVPRLSSRDLAIEAEKSLRLQRMFPVMFGRPDFLHDICSFGLARPDANVHVYICGNDAIVKDLQSVCNKCTEIARGRSEKKGTPRQKYVVHFERFG